MSKLFKINDKDNVAVALEELKKGEIIDNIKLLDDIPFGHKVLLNDLKSGENIIKYGNPIGHLTIDCKKGEHIHEHNLKTNLSDIIEYKYCGENEYHPKKCDVTFNGYLHTLTHSAAVSSVTTRKTREKYLHPLQIIQTQAVCLLYHSAVKTQMQKHLKSISVNITKRE